MRRQSDMGDRLRSQDKIAPGDSARPHADSPRFKRWRIGLSPEVLKHLATILLGALAYAQHAKPFCAGQPHSVPPTSKTLESYPCNAGAVKRAVYIYRNFFGVYSDMLNLGPSDGWVSAQLVLMFLNLVFTLVLPSPVYHIVTTTFFTQLFRLLPLVYLLMASYNGIAPSAAGHWFLTQHPFLDFLANLMMPVLPVSECVYGMTAMTLITLIWRRYDCLSGNAPALHCPADVQGLPATPSQYDMGGAILSGDPGAAPEAATAAFRSAFRLETSLSYQLLLCSLSTMASVAVEFWRGKPARRALQRSFRSEASPDAVQAAGSNNKPRRNQKCCAGPTGQGGSAGPSCGASSDDGRPAEGGRRKLASAVARGYGGAAGADKTYGAAVAAAAASLLDAARQAQQLQRQSPMARGSEQESVALGTATQQQEPAPQPASGAQRRQTPRQQRTPALVPSGPLPCPAQVLTTTLPNRKRDAAAMGLLSLSQPQPHGGSEETPLLTVGTAARKTAAGAARGTGTAGEAPSLTDSAAAELASGNPEPTNSLQQHLQQHPGRCGSRSSTPERHSHGSQAARAVQAAASRSSEPSGSSAPLSPLTAALSSFGAGPHGASWSNCEPTQSGLITSGATPRGSLVARSFMLDGDGPEEGDQGAAGTVGGGGSGGGAGDGDGRVLSGLAVGSFLEMALRREEFSEGSAPDVTRLDQRRNQNSQAGASAREGTAAPNSQDGAAAADPAAVRLPVLGVHNPPPSPPPALPVGDGSVAAGANADQAGGAGTAQRLPRAPQRFGAAAAAADGGDAGANTDAAAAAAAAAVAAGLAIQQARRPTYVPRVRLLTTHIKIQGADPRQLAPGYTERLGVVASAQGQRLMGVYVRSGCIELVLDSADWGDSKDSNVGEAAAAVSLPASGRDSGQLPPPLMLGPRYRSAPNTPSLLQRQQLQRHHHVPYQQQQYAPYVVAPAAMAQQLDGGQAAEAEAEALVEPAAPPLLYDSSMAPLPPLARVWSPLELLGGYQERPRSPSGSVRGGASPARCSLGQAAWGPATGLLDRRGGGGAGAQGQRNVQGPSGGGGGGRSGSTESLHASSAGAGVADLDLGAVIRALRLPHNDASGDTANDLASEPDMDLDYDDRFDGVAVGGGVSGMDSGVSGGAPSSKELSSGSAGRHADTSADGLLAGSFTLVATANTTLPAAGLGSATPRLLQQLQRQQGTQWGASTQQQRQLQQPQVQQPGPIPQAPASSASTNRSISRQALILGGPRNPFAPGIVTLKPRIFATKGPAEAGVAAGAAAAAAGATSPGPSSAGGVRFTAVVRRVGAAPPPAAGAFPPLAVAPAPGVIATAALSDLEFTIRARGEYLRLSAARAGLFPAMVGAAATTGGSVGSSTSGMAARGGGGRGWSGSGAAGEPTRGALYDDDVSMEGDGGRPRTVALQQLVGHDEELFEYGVGGGADALGDDADAYSSGGAGGGSGRAMSVPTWYESYSLELLQPPLEPGLLLVDLRPTSAASVFAASSSSVSSWSSALAAAPPCAVPVVAVSNPAMAAELQAVVDHWEGGPSELDDLLLDLGTWVHHVASQANLLLAYSAVQAVPAAGGGPVRPRLDGRLASLGLHLMNYAEACGWVITAASLRAELALFGALPPAGEPFPTAYTMEEARPWASLGRLASLEGHHDPQHAVMRRLDAAPVATPSAAVGGNTAAGAHPAPELQLPRASEPTVAAAAAAAALPWSLPWLRRRGGSRVAVPAAAEAAGTAGEAIDRKADKEATAAEEEEREFQLYRQSCISAQSWIMQLLDVFSMAALLFRGRHENLLSPTNAVTLLACCTGAFTAAARLVLPYGKWLRLAEAAKIPRHVCYCATKFLLGVMGVPAPPGIAAYELGLPVFVFEGLVVPWSCLLSPLAAVIVGAIKVPLYMALWHRLASPSSATALGAPQGATATNPAANGDYAHDSLSGHTYGNGRHPTDEGLTPSLQGLVLQNQPMTAPLRLLRALAVSGLSVAVTVACHAHIRAAFVRQRRKRAHIAAQQRQLPSLPPQQQQQHLLPYKGEVGDASSERQPRPRLLPPMPLRPPAVSYAGADTDAETVEAEDGTAARAPATAAAKNGKDD